MLERAPLLLSLTLLGCTHAGTLALEAQDDRYARCALRGAPAVTRAEHVAITGTIFQLRDESPVDGPVKLILIDGRGTPHKLYFQSLYTAPSPPPDVIATQHWIVRSQRGDCVQITGRPMSQYYLWVDTFSNLDRP